MQTYPLQVCLTKPSSFELLGVISGDVVLFFSMGCLPLDPCMVCCSSVESIVHLVSRKKDSCESFEIFEKRRQNFHKCFREDVALGVPCLYGFASFWHEKGIYST